MCPASKLEPTSISPNINAKKNETILKTEEAVEEIVRFTGDYTNPTFGSRVTGAINFSR
jgi:hypothetical protein